MSIHIDCPECGASYNLADRLQGKTVRCKKCQTPFVAEATEDDDLDRPRGARRKPSRPQASRRLVWILALAGGILVVGAAVGVILLLNSGKGGQDGKGGQGSGDSSESKPPARIPIDTKGWVFVERVLVSPKAAAVCYRLQNDATKHYCAVYSLASQQRSGNFELVNVQVPQTMAMSPDGTRLAVEEMVAANGAFNKVVTVWSLPDGKVLVTRWQPYPTVPFTDLARATEYRFSWMAFLEAGKLLTLTEGGRVSLWTLPGGKPIYDERPLVAEANKDLRPDIYSKEPGSFALSPDGKTLALRKGDGILLVDTATGKPGATLPPPQGLGKLPGMKGMAFSADGTKLAAAFTSIHGDRDLRSENLLARWDVKMSAVVGTSRLPDGWGGSAWVWWGNRYLVGLSGSVGESLVVDAETGKPVRQCFGPERGRFANGSPDGTIWYISSIAQGSGFLLGFSVPGLLASDPVADDGKGSLKQIWLTPDGVVRDAGDGRANYIKKIPTT